MITFMYHVLVVTNRASQSSSRVKDHGEKAGGS